MTTLPADTQSHLRTEPRLADPDAFYEALIEMHRGLSTEASQLVNAKLILVLANQIGDMDVMREAMALARRGVVDETTNKDPNRET